MTVTATQTVFPFTANGATTAFPFTGRIFNVNEIDVYVNGVLTLAGFVTTFSLTPPYGGTVTFAVAPVNGASIVIVRDTTITQNTDWIQNGADSAESKEDAVDRLTNIDQEIAYLLRLAPKFSLFSAFIDAVLSDPVVGQFLQWTSNSPPTIGSAVPVSAGSLSNPVSLAQGGTGVNNASNNALAKALNLALWKQGADIIAAAALPLPNPLDGNFFRITGNTTITSISTTGINAGTMICLQFTGSPLLTNSAALALTGGVDYTVTPGDQLFFIWMPVSAKWQEVGRFLATAAPTKFWRGDGTWQSIAIPNGIVGLTLSNNASDATNDIDVALGSVGSDDASPINKESMYLSSGITKRLDANWAVGTNQGGLDTGSIANTTYHVFLIKRTDTGVVDALFSTSATSPTMPTNYTKKQRIGSIIRSGGAILAFFQDQDEFLLNTSVLDVNASNPGTAAVTRTLTVPVGVKVRALLVINVAPVTNGGDGFFVHLSSLEVADVAPSATVAPLATYKTANTGSTSGSAQASVRTDTSAQIRSRCGPSSGASDNFRVVTLGWVDTSRGRN